MKGPNRAFCSRSLWRQAGCGQPRVTALRPEAVGRRPPLLWGQCKYKLYQDPNPTGIQMSRDVSLIGLYKKSIFGLPLALMVMQNCFALTIDELTRGLDQALAGNASSRLAVYVTGYIHGSAEYGRTLGLVCFESGKRSAHDELRAVRRYIDTNPAEWPDGVQLLINRALMQPECRN